MVEKAKSTRGTGARKPTGPASTATVGAGRGKRVIAPAEAPKVGRGRASTISDSSDASNGTTVVRKPVAAKKVVPAKKTVMSTIKGIGGTGSTKKLPAAKPAAPATGTRVLRKRNWVCIGNYLNFLHISVSCLRGVNSSEISSGIHCWLVPQPPPKSVWNTVAYPPAPVSFFFFLSSINSMLWLRVTVDGEKMEHRSYSQKQSQD
jgi:hypothetical protein